MRLLFQDDGEVFGMFFTKAEFHLAVGLLQHVVTDGPVEQKKIEDTIYKLLALQEKDPPAHRPKLWLVKPREKPDDEV